MRKNQLWIYESIRKKLLSEKENYINIHFNCKRKEEKKLGLADVLNNEDSEDFRAMLIDGEMNIEDILASGQFAKVWLVINIDDIFQ